MTSFRGKPWTNLERWTLFTFYKRDSKEDWYARCADEMEATRKDRIECRPKGYYTPAKCKAEFDRIMAEPCPSDVPTGANYSRAAVIDAWIQHLAEEDRKDAELYDDLMQNKLRVCEERLAAAWGNRDAFTNDQLEKMLADMKKELADFDYDEEELAARERMGAIYMKHLSELFYKEKEKKATKPRVSVRPQTAPAQSTRDAQAARPLPLSPGRATLKSPVRPTKEASSETPPSGASAEDQTVEKMDVDEVESKSSENSMDSPRNTAEPKRPRGRPPKKMTSATPQRAEDSASSTRDESPMQVGGTADDRNSPVRSEGRRSCARAEVTGSSTSTADKDNVHVVDSPAGRVRGARRPVAVESPLVKTSSVIRTSAGADPKDVKESSRERESSKSRQSAEVVPTRVATAPTTGVTTDEFGGTGTQTSISIQMPLSSGGDADLSTSRKSSRSERRGASSATTTPSVAAATRCSASVQTGEMKWDLEDNIVVGWPLSDAKVAPLANSAAASVIIKSEVEVMKTVNCKTDQTSRIISWDSVLSGAYDKKIKETSKNLDRLHMWDVCYCNFSEEALQVAKELALTQAVTDKSNFSLVASPPKRVRKEEKPSSSTLTTKGRMVSSWNLLQEHRHSAVFLHPVLDRDAPGYSRLVYCPVDLTTVKREIDNGFMTNPNVLMKKIFMMFSNATMFNSTGHDVNNYAKEMFNGTVAECTSMIDPRMDSYRVHHRRSRQDDTRRRSSLTPVAQSRTPSRKKQ